MPGDGKKHSFVGGTGDHHSGMSRLKPSVQHDMGALAHPEQRTAVGVRQMTNPVGKDAGSVDDGTGVQLCHITRLPVQGAYAGNGCPPLQKTCHLHVINCHPSLFKNSLHEVDSKPGIVKLPVVIEDAPLQATKLATKFQCGEMVDSLSKREKSGSSEAPLAGHPVVDLQPGPVPGLLPPAVGGDHERQIRDGMRCVPEQDTPLSQSPEDQRELTLGEVAYTAMNQFGTL